MRIHLGLVATLAVLAASPAALALPGGGNSAATITAAFANACRAFVAQSSKDISHVELHYADGRAVKDEAIGGPDYAIEGGSGDELGFAVVKSGTTRQLYTCTQDNSAPVARLDVLTPAGQTLEGCFDFWSGGLMCEQSTPRVTWTSSTQVPDAGGSDSGLFHWGCGALSDRSSCSFTISFRGITSSDSDGDIVSWSLDFGDGTSTGGSWSENPPAEVAHEYGAGCPDNVCVVTLTVTDAAGQSGSVSMRMAFLDLTPD